MKYPLTLPSPPNAGERIGVRGSKACRTLKRDWKQKGSPGMKPNLLKRKLAQGEGALGISPPSQGPDCTPFQRPLARGKGRTVNRNTTGKSGTRSSLPFSSPCFPQGCKKGRPLEPRSAILGDRQTVLEGRSFASFTGAGAGSGLPELIPIGEDELPIIPGPLLVPAFFADQSF